MTSKAVIVLIIIAIAAGAWVVMNIDELKTASVTDTTVIRDPAVDPNITKVQSYKGPIDVNMKASDSIATSTTYTDATNVVVNYYKKIDGVPVFITSSASNTAPIDVELADKTIYAEVHIPSGQAFYVDGAAISASHTRVGDPEICDWNNDNVDTYCFPLDVTGYTQNDENPGFTWFVRLFDEGSILLSVAPPADNSALGQGKTACSIGWEATMDLEGDAEYLTKVVLSLNQTDDDMWFAADSWTKINGVKFNFDEDGFNGDEKSTTYEYELKLAEDYLTQWKSIDDKGAIPLKFLINGDNEFDFETKLYTNFDANDEGITATLKLTTENAQGTPTEITDAVKCLET